MGGANAAGAGAGSGAEVAGAAGGMGALWQNVDGAGVDGAPAYAGEYGLDSHLHLPASEVNRLKVEREVLSLAAQNPASAIAYAPDLQVVFWHDPVHAALSGAILDTLVENPMADAASIIRAAAAKDARAGSILTGAVCEPAALDSHLQLLVFELKRGDLEQKIREAKARMQTLAGQDQQIEFEKLVALQTELQSMK